MEMSQAAGQSFVRRSASLPPSQKITDPQSVLQTTRNVEEMYLRTLSRFPDNEERSAAEQAIAKAGDPKRGYEDLLWALLNSKEFLYNH